MVRSVEYCDGTSIPLPLLFVSSTGGVDGHHDSHHQWPSHCSTDTSWAVWRERAAQREGKVLYDYSPFLDVEARSYSYIIESFNIPILCYLATQILYLCEEPVLRKKTRFKSSNCIAEAIRWSSWLICHCLEKLSTLSSRHVSGTEVVDHYFGH